jgi:hypothetical protein
MMMVGVVNSQSAITTYRTTTAIARTSLLKLANSM